MSDYTPAERIALMFVKRLKNILTGEQFQEFEASLKEGRLTLPDGVSKSPVMERAFHICGFCVATDIEEPDLNKARNRAVQLEDDAFNNVSWALDQQ